MFFPNDLQKSKKATTEADVVGEIYNKEKYDVSIHCLGLFQRYGYGEDIKRKMNSTKVV